jgi:hypothetical protein
MALEWRPVLRDVKFLRWHRVPKFGKGGARQSRMKRLVEPHPRQVQWRPPGIWNFNESVGPMLQKSECSSSYIEPQPLDGAEANLRQSRATTLTNTKVCFP